MACLGVKPGVAGWKAQTNSLSYGGTPFSFLCDAKIRLILQFLSALVAWLQCDQKKWPNVHKNCPKMISLEI